MAPYAPFIRRPPGLVRARSSRPHAGISLLREAPPDEQPWIPVLGARVRCASTPIESGGFMSARVLHLVRRFELTGECASLLPIRVFLGLGWLRAAIEKLIEPMWWDGTALRFFL